MAILNHAVKMVLAKDMLAIMLNGVTTVVRVISSVGIVIVIIATKLILFTLYYDYDCYCYYCYL